MATTPAVTREFRVHSITDAGNEQVLLGFTDLGDGNTPGAVPAYGTTASGITLRLERAEAAGIVPGDVYTVAFTKKV